MIPVTYIRHDLHCNALPRPTINLMPSKTIVVISNQQNEAQVIGETPIGLVDGSNATFTSAFDFVPESVEVFVETCRMALLDDYITAGTRTITFYVSPLSGEKIKINYTKQS